MHAIISGPHCLLCNWKLMRISLGSEHFLRDGFSSQPYQGCVWLCDARLCVGSVMPTLINTIFLQQSRERAQCSTLVPWFLWKLSSMARRRSWLLLMAGVMLTSPLSCCFHWFRGQALVEAPWTASHSKNRLVQSMIYLLHGKVTRNQALSCSWFELWQLPVNIYAVSHVKSSQISWCLRVCQILHTQNE